MRERSSSGGADVQIDFVGFEFDKGLAEADSVARMFEPGEDGGFDDGFTEFGDEDIDWHKHFFKPSRSLKTSKVSILYLQRR